MARSGKELDKRTFFFASELNAGMYDVTIGLVVPLYEEMHVMMGRLLELHFTDDGVSGRGTDTERVILDVGSGTGVDSLRLLQRFPSMKVVALDFSKPMNDVFRKNYESAFSADVNDRVLFIDGDILGEEAKPDSLSSALKSFTSGRKDTFDAVISAFTFHHLERAEKFEAYSRAYSVLKTGGLFLNGDLFSYQSSKLTDFAKEHDIEWIRSHFDERAEQIRSGHSLGNELPNTTPDCQRLASLWQYHYERDNRLDPIELQEQMLRFSGFDKTGIPFRYWQVGILWATK